MYKQTDFDQQQISFFHFNSSCGMQLDEENEWIKNGNKLPWKAWEAIVTFPPKPKIHPRN